MKAFLIRIFLLLFSVVLCIQLWIFASLAWWRFNPVNTTMMMRIDYWTEPSKSKFVPMRILHTMHKWLVTSVLRVLV